MWALSQTIRTKHVACLHGVSMVTCYFQMWKYHFFALEITWYFIGVYVSLPFTTISWNSCWDVNGKRFFGSSYWKIPPDKRKFWKGSPVFPVGTFQMEILLPFTSFLNFVLVSGLLAFGRAQSLQQHRGGSRGRVQGVRTPLPPPRWPAVF